MLILGVDPGLTRCGFGLIDSRTKKALDFGHFGSEPKDSPRDRVGQIAASLEALVSKHQPELIAIERVFAQANLRSVMGVAQISGALLFIAHQRNVPVQFFTPSEVKAAVTGNGRATKDQVQGMVIRLTGLEKVPGPVDVSDAIAVALCAAARGGTSGTEAQQKWVAAAKAANRRLG